MKPNTENSNHRRQRLPDEAQRELEREEQRSFGGDYYKSITRNRALDTHREMIELADEFSVKLAEMILPSLSAVKYTNRRVATADIFEPDPTQ